MSDLAIDLSRTLNKLLARLSRQDQELLRPSLQRCDLPVRTVLEFPHQPFEHVHFLEAGIASVMASTSRNRQVEIGIIGREGMTGLPRVLDTDRSPNMVIIQMAGRSLRIKGAALTAAMSKSVTLRNWLARFACAFHAQTAQTMLACSKAHIDERLARWLLMARDRTDSDALPVTHQFLSVMLGIRRPGVTEALHRLEGEHLIRATRGLVTIRDFDALRQYANGFYGVAEAEYERLLEPVPAQIAVGAQPLISAAKAK